ncbi:non-specific lipid transfer protein GPI-anchored 11-like isoform X2 [Primulina eburnea]|uniref:non-specific lipid transfer protein GPI-anchored 11-like isoform X2 n=1 Tax=Primulina eburnea TaxID=1245227 RepID=UPI003C6C5FB6
MAASSSVPFFCMMSLFAVLFSVVCSEAQTAPPPAVDCTSLVLNMADCLSFVMAGSTLKKPEGTCCSGLKMVLKTDADCLCETFRNSAQLGVTLDVKKAFTLPDACHVSAPSVGNCGLSNDTASGAAAPALSPSASPLSPSFGSSLGANDVSPTPVPASSGWSTARSSVVLLTLLKITVLLALF